LALASAFCLGDLIIPFLGARPGEVLFQLLLRLIHSCLDLHADQPKQHRRCSCSVHEDNDYVIGTMIFVKVRDRILARVREARETGAAVGVIH
jgi:hypothetical protein